MDHYQARRLLAAWDRHVENLGRLHAARRRMTANLLALGAGTGLVLLEALGLSILLQAGQRPPFIEYWGPLSAVGVALVAFATLRTAFSAHKEHITALMATKASKDELTGILATLNAMSHNVDHMRGLLEDLLKERRA